MQLCYLDESGDATPVRQGGTPILVVGGVTFSADSLATITRDLVDLKAATFPDMSIRHEHDFRKAILPELKGIKLKQAFRKEADPLATARAGAVLDGVLKILKRNDAKLVARVRRKSAGKKSMVEGLYERSVEQVCHAFNHRLEADDDFGLVIADNRDPGLNAEIAHAIYVQKFRSVDKMPRIVDVPTFAQSQNHAGIQLADIVCSALIYPIALEDAVIKQRFGHRVNALQRDYAVDGAQHEGGLAVFGTRGKTVSARDVLGV